MGAGSLRAGVTLHNVRTVEIKSPVACPIITLTIASNAPRLYWSPGTEHSSCLSLGRSIGSSWRDHGTSNWPQTAQIESHHLKPLCHWGGFNESVPFCRWETFLWVLILDFDPNFSGFDVSIWVQGVFLCRGGIGSVSISQSEGFIIKIWPIRGLDTDSPFSTPPCRRV